MVNNTSGILNTNAVCTDRARMPGVCLDLREIFAKGLEHGAIEVPTSLDANDVVQPKA